MLTVQLVRIGNRAAEKSYAHLQHTTYTYLQALPSVYVLLNPCQQAQNGLLFGLP